MTKWKELTSISEKSGQAYDLRGFDFENNIVFIHTEHGGDKGG